MNGRNIDVIKKYFPDLSEAMFNKLEQLGRLYVEWNEKINLISRKDIENIYQNHILHALSIRHVILFKSGSHILDVGTGGGLPGLPLAIVFPDCSFHLIDARKKKIMVVENIADKLGLGNVVATHIRAEALNLKYDFIVSRAVASIATLLLWTEKHISRKERNALPNGFILLKGGDLKKELKDARVNQVSSIYPLNSYFEESWYEGKKILYIPGP